MGLGIALVSLITAKKQVKLYDKNISILENTQKKLLEYLKKQQEKN
jgi:hypothetical protein